MSQLTWRKSSRSNDAAAYCVELAQAVWRKSRRSGSGNDCVELAGAVYRKSSRSAEGDNCVELADVRPVVAVRDSKDPDGPKLAFNPASFRAFTDEIKSGRHDL